MPKQDSEVIQKRGVFFIGGFDPKSAGEFFARNRREAERFEDLWGVSVTADDMQQLSDDVSLARYICEPADRAATGKDWTVTTDFHFLTLDDIVLKDFSRPFLTRLWRYIVTFSDYVFSGTAFRFFRHAWRFAGYFCYPALMLMLFAALSLMIANLVSGFGFRFSAVAGLIAGICVFYALARTAGQRRYVLHLMDLWSFSDDFIHYRREDIRNKLARLADLIATQAAGNDYDEILLIGHSTGGALILDAAGRTVEQHPQFLKTRGAIYVLTVGSTALKIGLHPKADRFRKRVGNIFAAGKINWVEYQCLKDLINFYKTDPAKLMNVAASPAIGQIKIRSMLVNKTYQRIKRNFFRIHYQFVFGNSKRYNYDFPAICLGPAPLARRTDNPEPFNKYLDGQQNQKSGTI